MHGPCHALREQHVEVVPNQKGPTYLSSDLAGLAGLAGLDLLGLFFGDFFGDAFDRGFGARPLAGFAPFLAAGALKVLMITIRQAERGGGQIKRVAYNMHKLCAAK